MAKDSKSSIDEGGGSGSRKRHLRILGIVIAGLILLGLYNPNLIDHPPIRNYFIQARDMISAGLPVAITAGQNLITTAQQRLKEPISVKPIQQFSDNIPDEIVVDEVVASFSAQIKTLPKKQVDRIISQICQDYSDETNKEAEVEPGQN